MGVDVVIVGGGVVGLAIAWRLALAGSQIVVLERGAPGREASAAALGLLLPSAGREGGAALLKLWQASLASYASFLAELSEETGISVEFRSPGRVALACSETEAEALPTQQAEQQAAGIACEVWSAEDVRAHFPEVGAEQYGGLFFPEHSLVDNRRLLQALEIAARRYGVEIRQYTPVVGLRWESERVTGVMTAEELLSAEDVVVCAGAWSGLLWEPLRPLVRPVKGQALALKRPEGPLPCMVSGRGVTLASRSDGRVLVGSTVEGAGFSRVVTAAGIGRLLSGALALIPGLAEGEVVEMWSGLRPGTPDGGPLLGRAAPGLYIATGHFQTGILSVPVTASLVVRELLTDEVDPLLVSWSPQRFLTAGGNGREELSSG